MGPVNKSPKRVGNAMLQISFLSALFMMTVIEYSQAQVCNNNDVCEEAIESLLDEINEGLADWFSGTDSNAWSTKIHQQQEAFEQHKDTLVNELSEIELEVENAVALDELIDLNERRQVVKTEAELWDVKISDIDKAQSLTESAGQKFMDNFPEAGPFAEYYLFGLELRQDVTDDFEKYAQSVRDEKTELFQKLDELLELINIRAIELKLDEIFGNLTNKESIDSALNIHVFSPN